MARMELLHLELLPLEPISAEIAIKLEFRTSIFQMLLNAPESLDRLRTTEALNLKALALDLYVLLKVLQIDALLNLVFIASVKHFDLTKHLIQKFVLDLLEDRSIN